MLLAVSAATLVGLAALLVAAGSGVRAQSSRATPGLPEPVRGACPRQRPQPLPGNALAGATLAALDQARAVYRNLNLKGMRATKAILADDDPARGAYAGLNCGRRVQRRTVVVYLQFPALLPSASLSQGVVLVSRFVGGYRIWAQLH